MDYIVLFLDGSDPKFNYIVKDCPSEVVALSEARIMLFEEYQINKWIEENTDRKIMIVDAKENYIENEEDANEDQ